MKWNLYRKVENQAKFLGSFESDDAQEVCNIVKLANEYGVIHYAVCSHECADSEEEEESASPE